MAAFGINDMAVIEGGSDNEKEVYASLQRAINDGMWGLQGSYGRAMMEAIKSGRCLCGRKPAFDYYGNKIPTRSEVQPGSMGSLRYVQVLSLIHI